MGSLVAIHKEQEIQRKSEQERERKQLLKELEKNAFREDITLTNYDYLEEHLIDILNAIISLRP